MRCYGLTITCLATVVLSVLGAQQVEKRVLLGKKVYLITNQKMNWYAAINYCHAKGMHLLTIESAEEHNLFVNHWRSTNPKGPSVWTAGNDLAAENKWDWLTTGNPILYTNWAKGEPNNFRGKEYCIELRYPKDYYWNDLNCMDVIAVVCEARLTSTKDKAVKRNPQIVFQD